MFAADRAPGVRVGTTPNVSNSHASTTASSPNLPKSGLVPRITPTTFRPPPNAHGTLDRTVASAASRVRSTPALRDLLRRRIQPHLIRRHPRMFRLRRRRPFIRWQSLIPQKHHRRRSQMKRQLPRIPAVVVQHDNRTTRIPVAVVPDPTPSRIQQPPRHAFPHRRRRHDHIRPHRVQPHRHPPPPPTRTPPPASATPPSPAATPHPPRSPAAAAPHTPPPRRPSAVPASRCSVAVRYARSAANSPRAEAPDTPIITSTIITPTLSESASEASGRRHQRAKPQAAWRVFNGHFRSSPA